MMETLKEIVELLNPWWKDNGISKELALPFKRRVFGSILGLIGKRQIVILSGLRRVGKTTLLYQAVERLLSKYDSRHLFYFNLDKKIEDLTEILKAYEELTAVDWKKEKIFVFIDEISKLKEWGRKIKLLYDAFPNIKFVISSSGSVGLEEEAITSLGGRYFLVSVVPLNFTEFLELGGKKKFLGNIALWEDEIVKEVKKYMLRSFPEIIEWKDELLIKDYLRTTLIDRIIKQDLPEKFKNVNRDLLLTLLEIFYGEPGMYLDYDSLSKKMRISKKTLIQHIYYLEFSYLIRRVRNFRPNTLTASKKLQKVYANWWTLAYCYSDNNDKIIENLVASYSDAKYYWRKNGKEIDFLMVDKNKKGFILIEVKNKNELAKSDVNNFRYFLRKYGSKTKMCFVVYNGKEGQLRIGRKRIRLVPLWKWLLEK